MENTMLGYLKMDDLFSFIDILCLFEIV